MVAKTWYECKVSYLRPGDDGLFTKTTESYLVDAVNFTEAEKIVTERVSSFSSGEFVVNGIKKMKLSEVFLNYEGDRWYRCKVIMTIVDEEKQKEKELACAMLISAFSLDEALTNLNKNLSNSMSDYRIASLSEMSLMDIFVYTPSDSEE